jgi:hypothetical protein
VVPLAFTLLQALLQELCSLHVIIRNSTINRVTGAIYDTEDVISIETVQHILSEVQPRLIFHVASSGPAIYKNAEKIIHKTVVNGTKHLLIVLSLLRPSKRSSTLLQ